MGHVLSKEELEACAVPERAQTRADLARYAADMLASLSRLSEENGMPLLAHLTSLARMEALRHQQAAE